MKGYLFAILLLPASALAQSKFYINGIAGQYSMKNMKEFQKGLSRDFLSSGIPMKVITDFPVSLQFEIGFDKLFDNNEIGNYSLGGYLNYALTKGRMHYADYSGEVFADQNISRISLGGKASTFSPFGISIYGKLGLNYSLLELEFLTDLYGIGTDSKTLNFYSIGINVEPGIAWSFSYKKFLVSFQAGYEMNIQGRTIFKENKDAYLQNNSGDKVILNWSGARLGLTLAYKLSQ